MRNNNWRNVMIVIGVIVLAAGSAYKFLHPPQAKPLPEQTENQIIEQAPVERLQGMKPFAAEKYKTEPTITVWVAERHEVISIKLEKYLEGVIAKEMVPDWPLEALAAQAIASRTLTIAAIENGTIRNLHNTDVSTAKEELQAYAPEKINDKVRAAVHETRGQVLLYGDSLIHAIYSSCNGQMAATKEESFPKEIAEPTPYFQVVADTCFEYAPLKEQAWTVKIPGREVATAIGYSGDPRDISILEKGPSGRILWIGAGTTKIYGSDFRRAVGFDRLRSTLVTDMNYDGKDFTFHGQGWGNGVGLCQWGAYTYATQGMKAGDILARYYIGATIKKIWE